MLRAYQWLKMNSLLVSIAQTMSSSACLRVSFCCSACTFGETGVGQRFREFASSLTRLDIGRMPKESCARRCGCPTSLIAAAMTRSLQGC